MEKIIEKIQTVIDLMGFKESKINIDTEYRKISIVIDDETAQFHTAVLLDSFEHLFNLILRKEKFVAAAKKLYMPGIIGPFALQAAVKPGPPEEEIIVFDISARIPGSPGIAATPYSSYLYGKPVTSGRRIAMEIRQAIRQDRIMEIVT